MKGKCQFLIGNVNRIGWDNRIRQIWFHSKVSIPHRQCKQLHLSAFFLHHTPPPLQNQLFSPKKYVDLFYIRIAVTRMFTRFTDILLHSENLMLRSTYIWSWQGNWCGNNKRWRCRFFAERNLDVDAINLEITIRKMISEYIRLAITNGRFWYVCIKGTSWSRSSS